jgi:hypothetical protein
MPYDMDVFFDRVRVKPFGGSLTQRQVDGMNYLMMQWEGRFEESAAEQSTPWLAYCLATVFHETAQKMVPIEEYGRGDGRSYGNPVGPYEQCYYGRGHVQLTWEENYIKGEGVLHEYGMNVPLHQYPHRMLEDEPSAVVLYDGMIDGWFTGVGLPKFFDENTEDPYNARTIVNGHDKADVIARYYEDFKAALVQVDPPKKRRPALAGLRR